MFTEFASVQLTHEELRQIHEALVQRAIVEERLRGERGQESVDNYALLAKFEMLLGEREEVLHALDHALEDDLWEYAWFVYTDEWAWFRAKSDVEKELGEEGVKKMSASAFENLVGAKYCKNFDKYVAEVDMLEKPKTVKRIKKQAKKI